MALIRRLDETNYYNKENVNYSTIFYPIDNYSIPEKIIDLSDEHHFILIPLIGQYVRTADETGPFCQTFYCGRTSGCMIYNYHVLSLSGEKDPKDLYIRFSRGENNSYYRELRYPNHTRAHVTSFRESKNYNYIEKCATTIPVNVESCYPELAKYRKHFDYYNKDFTKKEDYIDKVPSSDRGRIDKLEQEAENPEQVKKRFNIVEQSLLKNNPVIISTGLSSNTGHFVDITGFCYIQNELWLLIADPSGGWKYFSKEAKNKHLSAVFKVCPEKNINALTTADCKDKYTLIMIKRGDWVLAQAGLYLLKAKTFLLENLKFKDSSQPKVFLDYFYTDSGGSATHWGGRLSYSIINKFPAPAELIKSSYSHSLFFPIELYKDTPPNPVHYFYNNETTPGGYYPLGFQKNLHGGIHLHPPYSGEKPYPVRAPLDGYVMAARIIQPEKHEIEGGILSYFGNYT
ncbi:MAG: hypothetical protein JXJ04_21050, partial [Spirochaetales bacterium]|nr:hypothetical protein [Spirochaetales bacterium]